MSWLKSKWHYVGKWILVTLFHVFLGWAIALDEVEEEYKQDKKLQEFNDRLEVKHKEWLKTQKS